MTVNETHDSSTSPELVTGPLAAEEVAARLDARSNFGLTSAEARQRRVQHGPNRLPEASPRSAWLVFFGQFKSILILILIGAALLAAPIGNAKDAVIILAVVGFYQEYRADQSLAALKGMLPVKTRVWRDRETEKGRSFNAHFFDNTMLWVSLAGIIALPALAVHWPRAQPIFGTGGMNLADRGIATGVAVSVLILEEGRKLAMALPGRFGPRATPAGSA